MSDGPRRQVIATAGHVDHGKSTLIRALTGIEPDRWAEERERGLTLDLGFAWTTLPSGAEAAFVDVPGHERYLANTLAGLGAAPIVALVIAADEGWREQTSDHRDAIAALGIDRGLIVVTRVDLAPDAAESVIARARHELAGTGLADAPALAVSAATGQGIDELRGLLDQVVAEAPSPDPAAPLRLWLDRSFTIAGAGTVVTGTLGAGTLARGDRLELLGAEHHGEVTVRGLQSRGGDEHTLTPVTRAAVNLRGMDAASVGRGDVLLTPGAWTLTAQLDARALGAADLSELPAQVVVHCGTAAVPARARPLGAGHVRLTLDRHLPLRLGDRLVLRSTDSRRVRAGLAVLDVDPPTLSRRGDGHRRTETLEAMPPAGDLTGEVARRGALRAATARRHGLPVPEHLPQSLRRVGEWLVDTSALQAWAQALTTQVAAHHRAEPLSAGLPRAAAIRALGLPDPALLPAVVAAAGLREQDGRLRGEEQGMGEWESALATLEARLREAPFHAPEAHDLTALDLDTRALAAAARQGRVLRLPGEVILLPTAPALAMRELAALGRPFTAAEARRAWDTTRRVAIPLLEHLDGKGWTRRLDATHREVVRRRSDGS
ncbi:selenocysteine-specific translation elongation factor [Brachybacterium squillarum]|uniref:selenocysteine-specific translation elongation factor n=1 Tax=Brachybacterium squillarum TaxID=661979 RepID=UPI0002629797|nr:selenocysteine-specific translation elongation factor [Brachybacterium squillarum]